MSEIELNGNLITTELKKPHPFRLVGGVETQNKLVQIYLFSIKIQDISGMQSPTPTTGPQARDPLLGG